MPPGRLTLESCGHILESIAHPRAMETLPEAIKQYRLTRRYGGSSWTMNTQPEPWELTLEPWRLTLELRRLTLEPWRLTLAPWTLHPGAMDAHLELWGLILEP